MTTLGYVLSSEEQTPRRLVELATRAEQAGFELGLISDHYLPWVEAQGESGFVWSVIGAISRATSRLRIGTGVTCPTMRTHPAIIAQAAATTEQLMPGRFFLGLGTGEKLNEHVVGGDWPPIKTRQGMLYEAIDVIRQLWTGDEVDFEGKYYRVEDAKLYSIPDAPPPLLVAASGKDGAEKAGEIADGLISTAPDREIVEAFEATGNRGHRVARLSVCYAEDEEDAISIAMRYWPNGAIHGSFMLDLALPRDFEAVAGLLTPEQVTGSIVCGPDPRKHIARIEEYIDAGFDEVCIHQAGPEQDGFFRFYEREILPHFQSAASVGTNGKSGKGGRKHGNG
jgi:G6PDH family F420-dependent oxidoreductase